MHQIAVKNFSLTVVNNAHWNYNFSLRFQSNCQSTQLLKIAVIFAAQPFKNLCRLNDALSLNWRDQRINWKYSLQVASQEFKSCYLFSSKFVPEIELPNEASMRIEKFSVYNNRKSAPCSVLVLNYAKTVCSVHIVLFKTRTKLDWWIHFNSKIKVNLPLFCSTYL